MIQKPAHHTKRGFRNPWPGFEEKGFLDLLAWMLFDHRKSYIDNGRFCGEIGTVGNDGAFLRSNDSGFTVTWAGHSTILVQLGGVNILADPVWGERVPPLSCAVPRRHGAAVPAFRDLPRIDAVVITHNHYDHLDRGTIERLGDSPQYFVPLGVGRLMRSFGVSHVIEMDWWQSCRFHELEFVCTPTQHFSGRGLFDRNRTLWCSWLVRGDSGSFYTAGDTGYFPGFREIGERYGPIDAACIPIGAYLPRWFMQPVHVDPDEAVRAFLDLRAKYFIPIHFGTFRLADDPLWLPPEELRKALECRHVPPERTRILQKGETWVVENPVKKPVGIEMRGIKR